MSMLTIYFLVTLLPNLSDASIGSLLFCLLMVLASLMVFCINGPNWAGEQSDYDKNLQKSAKSFRKIFSWLAIICLVLRIIVPSKEQTAIIIAGAYATQMQGVKDLPPKIMDLLNTLIDKELGELKKKDPGNVSAKPSGA